MRAALSSLLLLIAACEHSSPFTFVPGTQGPWGGGLPRRLTFSAGDDRNAAVTGGLIVFSRLEASALATRERCLALLPVDGGTLRGEYCPRLPTTLADTFLDTWTEPALSPDGHWVAYSWQQGSLVSVLGFYRTRLVVAPTAHADDTTRFAWYIDYAATAGTVTGILKPEWLDADRIRFLGAYEFFFKVKGGGQERYTDTTFVPLALLELDLRTGLVALVPGGDSATAWARAPDGGAWIVKAGDPARLLHLAAGMDVSTTVGVFTDSVRDLAAVAGTPVAVLGDTTIEWLDPVTGVVAGSLTSRTPVRRLSAVAGTRRFVVEIERDWSPFGWPANLWLFELP